MPLIKVNDSIETLFEMIRRRGAEEYAGESLSQLEHFCQAATIAEKETNDEELILAAFFHDIGNLCRQVKERHTMNGQGVLEHETIGARFLAALGFSQRIVTLVENHVLAKRYLTYKFPDYYLALSDAGRGALEFQGGPLCMEEAFQFEAHPYFNDVIQLRRWDEQAKQTGTVMASVGRYRDMAMYHLVRESNMPGSSLLWQQKLKHDGY